MARLPDGYRVETGTGRIVPIQRRQATVTQFMRRLSLEEYVLLNAIIMDPSADLTVRAQLQTLKDIRDGTQNKLVDFDNDQTQIGVQVALNVLAEVPEGTPGRVDPATVPARIVAWLADFPQPGEPT